MQRLQAIYAKLIANKTELINFLKWLSVPVVLLALYYQLFVQTDFKQAWHVFQQSITKHHIGYLLLCLLLTPINLGAEATKWQLLINKLHPISLLQSLQSVVAGISFSIFTPKRIGEYAGRVITLKKNKSDAVAALFVSNLSQAIANLLIGLVSIALFAGLYSLSMKHFHWIVSVACITIFALFLLYFNLPWLTKQLSNFRLFHSRFISIQQLDKYSMKELLQLLFYSMAKYLIFILQFVLIIKAFGIQISLFIGIVCASCVFFVKTLLPVPATVELAARGSIAIFFFSQFTENHIGILVASILLWVVNLAIPALAGSLLITRTKF